MNINSKLTTYDAMAMFAIGILFIFVTGMGEKYSFDDMAGVYNLALLSILAYVIGLLFHSMWEFILRCLVVLLSRMRCQRNNSCYFKDLFVSFVKCQRNYSYFFKDLFASFVRNNKGMIERARQSIYETRGNRREEDISSALSADEYLSAYYALMKAGMLYNIPALEAQEAFLRNLVPVCITALFTLDSRVCRWLDISSCGYYVGMAALIIALLMIHAKVQRKIFESVWEGWLHVNPAQEKKE